MKREAPAPLRLKRQRGAHPKRLHSEIAEVLIDHEVFHLDSTFSYGIPDSLQGKVRVGTLVNVDFRNEARNGVVLAIVKKETKVKPILSLSGDKSYPTNIVQLINAVRSRYIASYHDVSRFARPTKTYIALSDVAKTDQSQPRFFLATRSVSIETLVSKRLKETKGTLIVCETEAMVNSLADSLSAHGIGNIYMQQKAGFSVPVISDGDSYVAIGMRGSIFSALPLLSRILIINECSTHHLEQRRPRWNTRDVALLRQRIEGCELEFIGTSMSCEIGRLIDEGGIKFQSERRFGVRHRPRFDFYPDTFHQTIRSGLTKGSVLVAVAEKSYSNLVLCAQCNGSIQCKCGGRLVARTVDILQCNLCGNQNTNWRCTYCQSSRFKTLRKGAGRIAEEIGKAFPQTPIVIATSDHVPAVPTQNSIVIATFGAEPKIENGYASLILLDGEQLSARGFMRSEENLLHRWSSLIASSPKATAIYLSLPAQHRVVQSILSESPQRFIRDELANRKATNLPPYSRVVLVSGNEGELLQLMERLHSEFPSDSLHLSINHGTLVMKMSHELAPSLLSALRALQHYRSAHGDELLNIEVDPFAL